MIKVVKNLLLLIGRGFCKTNPNPRLERIILRELVRYEATFHGYVTNLGKCYLARNKIHEPRTVLLVIRYKLKLTRLLSSLSSVHPITVGTTSIAEVTSRIKGAGKKAT